MGCDKLEVCPFFTKHAVAKPLACESLVLRFCKGPERALCARDQFYRQYGIKPDDDMTPMGTILNA